MEPGTILDEYGQPMEKPSVSPRPRFELDEVLAKAQSEKHLTRPVHAKYEAAQDGDEHKNIWANSDSLDADSANSVEVRRKLVQRSRYEIANNGIAAGIARTYATDLVGMGPTLRMQTGSEGFNQLVERTWQQWAKEVQFRRKLWTMAHAKHGDGEAFAVLRQNRNMKHRVRLDMVLHETEQCHTPFLTYGREGYIDGIEFDEFGNPRYYDFLDYHPGANDRFTYEYIPEKVPAKFVLHWFRMSRPGQHRGIPESTSTLNLGAAARRFREAVIAAAETAADFTALIHTNFEPDEMDAVTPMSTSAIQKRMLVALPSGYDAKQMKAEHPTSTFEQFNKMLVNEQARPISMPLNKAMANSADYNYASGRLDHQTYYGSLDTERKDCDDLVLDHLFSVWFETAVRVYGWLGGDPDALSEQAAAHTWDWPKHQVADIKSEAQADETNLKNGSTNLPAVHKKNGSDYEDALQVEARANGITVDQQRQINLLRNTPQHSAQYVAEIIGLTPAPAGQAPAQDDDDAEEE